MQSLSARFIRRAVGLGLLALFLCMTATAQQFTVTGKVLDTTGAAIAGAEVTLHSPQATQSVKTGRDGGFTFVGVTGDSGSVRVTADTFAPAELPW